MRPLVHRSARTVLLVTAAALIATVASSSDDAHDVPRPAAPSHHEEISVPPPPLPEDYFPCSDCHDPEEMEPDFEVRGSCEPLSPSSLEQDKEKQTTNPHKSPTLLVAHHAREYSPVWTTSVSE